MSGQNQPADGEGADAPAIDEQAMWRNWDPRLEPWPSSPTPAVVYDGGRFYTAFTVEDFSGGYYSDESEDYVIAAANMQHLRLDDPPEQDIWRTDFLEFVLAQRACAARRQAAGLAPTPCTRQLPCGDCIFHPGATATSVHWQCMDDARLNAELDAYLLERSPVTDWMPPSPTSELRRLQPPRLLFSAGDPAATHSAYGSHHSNHASPSSSVRSDPPSPSDAKPASSFPTAPSAADRPVFGPPRPPPTYEELSD